MLTDRVAEKIDASGDCWEWTGNISRFGYGRGPNAKWLAHRKVWEDLVGPLGDLTIHHMCQNKTCVNPDHLQPMPMEEHARLKARGARCKNGHLNKWEVNVRGHRVCKKCLSEASYRAWKNRHR